VTGKGEGRPYAVPPPSDSSREWCSCLKALTEALRSLWSLSVRQIDLLGRGIDIVSTGEEVCAKTINRSEEARSYAGNKVAVSRQIIM